VKVFLTTGKTDGRERGEGLVVVFGIGLVGGAVGARLVRAGARCVLERAIDWREGSSLRQAVEKAYEIAASRATAGIRPYRFSVLWAAGSGGFHSPEEKLFLELKHFQEVLTLGERLRKLPVPCEPRFFLLSSAGGLFEGQSNVNSFSVPAPLRGYGRYKLLQEKTLESAPGYASTFVYRPSTIYGHSPKGRVGLISALLLNGIRHRVSLISGSATTLRDYVFNGDVARFLVGEILNPPDGPGHRVRFLVSAKPSSILEIGCLVEELLRRKLYLAYETGPRNALHNTYSHTLVPRGWSSTGLREGVQAVLRGVTQSELI
jgi:UDP-glucose 4-epimerase